MADIPITTKTTKTIKFDYRGKLAAGQKLTDIPELLELAQKTIPAGYKANLHIRIHGIFEEV